VAYITCMGKKHKEHFETSITEHPDISVDENEMPMKADPSLVLTDSRRIFIWGVLDEESLMNATAAIVECGMQNQKAPIELWINSVGGLLDSSLGLVDVIRNSPAPVHTYTLGSCKSAALLLVAAGSSGSRYAYENTRFMLHSVQIARFSGSMEDLEGFRDEASFENDRYVDILSSMTRLDKKTISGFLLQKREHYFGAQTALTYGLVDKVISKKAAPEIIQKNKAKTKRSY